jgi:O-antigen/teichoic acid export membrane protein
VAASGLRGPVVLVLLTFVLTFPLRASHAILQGLQDLKFLGVLRVWLWALSAALSVVLLLLGAGFFALACGWCAQEAGTSLIAVIRLRRLRPDLFNRQTWRSAGTFRWQWLTRGLWISLGQVSNAMVGGTDLLIIARVFGPATVVIYSCTGKLVQVLQQQPQVLASTALPGLSQMKTSEMRGRVQKAATCLTQAMILVAGGIVCIVLPLNQQFVNHWIGARYFGGVVLTVLFLANFLVRLIDYTLALALFAFGHEKLFAIRAMLDGVVSVILAAILVRPLGLNGVILGFLCGALLVPIPLDLHRFAREFDVSIRAAAQPYVPYLWRITAVGVVAFAIMRRIELPNLFSLAIAATLVSSLYLLVTIPYVRKTELGGYIGAAVQNIPLMRGWGFVPPSADNSPDEPEAVAVGAVQEIAPDSIRVNQARSE